MESSRDQALGVESNTCGDREFRRQVWKFRLCFEMLKAAVNILNEFELIVEPGMIFRKELIEIVERIRMNAGEVARLKKLNDFDSVLNGERRLRILRIK